MNRGLGVSTIHSFILKNIEIRVWICKNTQTRFSGHPLSRFMRFSHALTNRMHFSSSRREKDERLVEAICCDQIRVKQVPLYL